jgi:probable HAF family extracellular repeat protein
MSIRLANIPARMLSRAAACALAAALAGCGGGGDDHHHYYPPPPPKPAGITYDVIPLSLGGTGSGAVVRHNAITADGKVAGTIDVPGGALHAFLYDGKKMIDLGTMGGTGSEATGLNQRGQVVGWAYAKGWSQAFLYDGDGGMHDLGNFGGADAYAAAISESGQITGYATTADGVRHAFLYRDGLLKQLSVPGIASAGWAINGGGQVAGNYQDGGQAKLAFLDEVCGCVQTLGTLGGAEALVYGLNDVGQVIGVSDTAVGQRHAFLYQNGAMKDLGTFGGTGSFAAAINEAGLVAGDADNANGNAHAFLYDGNSLKDLGGLGGDISKAAALNGVGQVVGYALTKKGEPRAFSWTEAEGLVDLNTRIPRAPYSLVLTGAAAVSDSGAIVAYSNAGLVLLKVHQSTK